MFTSLFLRLLVEYTSEEQGYDFLFLGSLIYETYFSGRVFRRGFFLKGGSHDLCVTRGCLTCRSKKTHGLPAGQTTT